MVERGLCVTKVLGGAREGGPVACEIKRNEERSLTSTSPAVDSSIACFANTVARSWLRVCVNLATVAILETDNY